MPWIASVPPWRNNRGDVPFLGFFDERHITNLTGDDGLGIDFIQKRLCFIDTGSPPGRQGKSHSLSRGIDDDVDRRGQFASFFYGHSCCAGAHGLSCCRSSCIHCHDRRREGEIFFRSHQFHTSAAVAGARFSSPPKRAGRSRQRIPAR